MVIAIMLVLLGVAQVSAPPEKVNPRVVAELDGYSEGVVQDQQGAIYVSLLRRGAVYRLDSGGQLAVWLRVPEPNGHKVLADGTHLIAARGGVHRVAPSGQLLGVISAGMVTPNDIALDGNGGVYVSVPAALEDDRRQGLSSIYYLNAKGAAARVADGFCYPNGIIVRPDGQALLANDSCARQVFLFDIQSPGVLSGKRIFAEVPDARSITDGMTFDLDGHLYMADYGTGDVFVFDFGGRLVRRYPTGMRRPSNVAFVGSAGDLYVSGAPLAEEGAGQLVVLPLGVRGRSGLSVPAALPSK
jgi:gluconolactonase